MIDKQHFSTHPLINSVRSGRDKIFIDVRTPASLDSLHF